MLARIENGVLIRLPRTYEYDSISYSNYDLLPEETLLSHGWKIFDDAPQPSREGYYYTPEYTQGDSITVQWLEHENPIDTTPDYMAFIGGLLEGYAD